MTLGWNVEHFHFMLTLAYLENKTLSREEFQYLKSFFSPPELVCRDGKFREMFQFINTETILLE